MRLNISQPKKEEEASVDSLEKRMACNWAFVPKLIPYKKTNAAKYHMAVCLRTAKRWHCQTCGIQRFIRGRTFIFLSEYYGCLFG
jgi:PHP family Zn ribbon phosphoesterase